MLHRALPLILASLLAVFALTSCPSTGALGKPSLEFTRAGRAYVDTLGTEFRAYVQADESLTEPQRQNRLDAVGDFEFAVRMAEKRHGIIPPAAPATPAEVNE